MSPANLQIASSITAPSVAAANSSTADSSTIPAAAQFSNLIESLLGGSPIQGDVFPSASTESQKQDEAQSAGGKTKPFSNKHAKAEKKNDNDSSKHEDVPVDLRAFFLSGSLPLSVPVTQKNPNANRSDEKTEIGLGDSTGKMPQASAAPQHDSGRVAANARHAKASALLMPNHTATSLFPEKAAPVLVPTPQAPASSKKIVQNEPDEPAVAELPCDLPQKSQPVSKDTTSAIQPLATPTTGLETKLQTDSEMQLESPKLPAPEGAGDHSPKLERVEESEPKLARQNEEIPAVSPEAPPQAVHSQLPPTAQQAVPRDLEPIQQSLRKQSGVAAIDDRAQRRMPDHNEATDRSIAEVGTNASKPKTDSAPIAFAAKITDSDQVELSQVALVARGSVKSASQSPLQAALSKHVPAEFKANPKMETAPDQPTSPSRSAGEAVKPRLNESRESSSTKSADLRMNSSAGKTSEQFKQVLTSVTEHETPATPVRGESSSLAHTKPAPSATPADLRQILSTHPLDQVPVVTTTKTTVREITVRIPPTEGQQNACEVQILEKNGKVQVTVHTADTNLSSSLRGDLAELVSTLDRKGFQTETWTPPQTHPGFKAEATLPQTSLQSDGQQNDPQQNGSQQEQQQAQAKDEPNPRRRQNRPAWLIEFEETLGK